jgi:hypothetical protein
VDRVIRISLGAISAALVIGLVAPGATRAAEVPFGAQLRGSHVVADDGTANQGDPDGRMNASLIVDTVSGEVCVTTNAVDLDTPTSFRLHEAPAGENGPAVLDLPVPALGRQDLGCVAGTLELAAAIVADSSRFYLLVTTDEYPDGAGRGQLAVQQCMVVVHEKDGDTLEPTDLLFLDEGHTATVRMTHFTTGAAITFTVSHEGTLVTTGVSDVDQDHYAFFDVPFKDGDAGEWTVLAEDPTIGGCAGSVTIHVAEASFKPDPSDNGGLPDTALPHPGDGSGYALVVGLVVAWAGVATWARGARRPWCR